MDEHANREESANIEEYLNMEDHANLEVAEHNDRNVPETYERIFYYDDGVVSEPIPYSRRNAPNILEALNAEQEFLANQKGISTVWRCTPGGSCSFLDIEDDCYPIPYGGLNDKRMVYRFAVAAANALNRRIYTYMDSRDHYEEFWRVMGYMAEHNKMINQR
ncbi:hypothetical protein KCU95_g1385, partial [Aureobasidium melanogenum]